MIPMRRANREIKDEERLQAVIEECKVVRIGAIDEEGMFIVPVNYGYEWKKREEGEISLRLYIHSAKEGRKARAFRKNSKVAIEMDCGHELIKGDYTCSYSFAYRSIMGTGRIRLITDKQEKIQGFQRLMEHVAPGARIDFDDRMVEAADVYCIEVTEWKGKERQKK